MTTETCEVVENKPTIIDRLRWKTNNIKHFFKTKMVNISLSVIRWSEKDCNYKKHALREFVALGYEPLDKNLEEDPNKWIQENILDLLAVFGTQGHSGSSAPYCANMFKKLALFEPLGPLTGKDSEWGEPYCADGTRQNNRCSHVFKEKDGRAYDMDGKVFREPNGCCYTSKDSRVYIEFPYTPKTEYVDVDEGEE